MPARLPPQPSHPAGPARTESGHGRPSAIQGRTGLLTLRDGHDAAFVRRLWADTSFMRSFHRLAPPLPKEDAELVRIMNLECSNSIRQSRAVHWVVRSPDRQPWGLLSLTDISLQHKRAEVLLGVLPGIPPGRNALVSCSKSAAYHHEEYLASKAVCKRFLNTFLNLNSYHQNDRKCS